MSSSIQKEPIEIRFGSVHVAGLLELPPDPAGIVLFAHGSGSSRFSPRNNYVAGELHNSGMGTLLMDLLTPEEDQNINTRFDISLLTKRLNGATDWLREHRATKYLPIGLFGASTGAAAALQLAALRESDIAALVLRGGRTDMAGSIAQARVRAPTMLIVGGLDAVVMELNQSTYAALQCEKRLEIIDGASHLFEEPGKLEAVAAHARQWFARHLQRTAEDQIYKHREQAARHSGLIP